MTDTMRYVADGDTTDSQLDAIRKTLEPFNVIVHRASDTVGGAHFEGIDEPELEDNFEQMVKWASDQAPDKDKPKTHTVTIRCAVWEIVEVDVEIPDGVDPEEWAEENEAEIYGEAIVNMPNAWRTKENPGTGVMADGIVDDIDRETKVEEISERTEQ
jgi:hypothetical protein